LKALFLLAAIGILSGCSNNPEPASTPNISITDSKSQTVTVSQDGNTRTDSTSRTSHSDEEGAQSKVQVSNSKTGPDGTTSQESKVISSSADANDDSLGYTRTDKNIAVSGSNVTRTIDVTGQDVAVSGNGNQLTFSGDTHGISVTGSDNKITVQSPDMIEVSGERNQVTYGGSTPTVKNEGSTNVVQAQ
jgi:hypothetical protein